MGAKNNSGVLLMWSHLDDGAFRLLSGMAHRALDKATVLDTTRYWPGPTPAGRWFAGVDELVTLVRSHDSQGNVRSYAARRSAAFRFLAQLRAAGAVKVLVSAVNGDRAEYALNVDPLALDEFKALVEDPRVDRSKAVDKSPGTRGSNLPSVRKARTLQRPSESDAQRPSESDAQRPSESDAPSKGTTKEPLRSNYKENLVLGEHVQSRATTPSDEEPGWSDVMLVDTADGDAAEVYPAAMSYLDRTLGFASAGALVASYLAEHTDASSTRAVVEIAAAQGWTP